jgi:hypothetical protein
MRKNAVSVRSFVDVSGHAGSSEEHDLTMLAHK